MSTYQRPPITLAPPIPRDLALEANVRDLCAMHEWQRRRFIRGAKGIAAPKFLYKFRSLDAQSPESIDRIRQVIVDSLLRLSSPATFNDPFDMSARVVIEGTVSEKISRYVQLVQNHAAADVSSEERARIVASLVRMPQQELAARMQEIVETRINATGVYSLAGNARNMLMWSHYGQEHQGVCLQFEMCADPATILAAADVDYDDTYPVFNWAKDPVEQVSSVVLRKHSSWKYEEERRIIVPDGAGTFLPFNGAALTGVILGCKAPSASEQVVDRLFAERGAIGLPAPALYRAIKVPAAYGLRFQRVK